MNRLCTITLGILYSFATGLSMWFTWEFQKLQQPLLIPILTSAVFAALALYSWSEWSAISRIGRPRYPLVVTLPFTILIASTTVAVVWPHRRVTAKTTILDDIRTLPPESPHAAPAR